MNIYEIKKYKKRTILTGYFSEDLVCDDCVARGGSEFKNILQPIYLTITYPEKDVSRPYTDVEVEKNYCYSCGKKELEKEIKEIDDCWDQRNQEKIGLMRCAKCQGESDDKARFKRHKDVNYCLDCLNYVLQRLY